MQQSLMGINSVMYTEMCERNKVHYDKYNNWKQDF